MKLSKKTLEQILKFDFREVPVSAIQAAKYNPRKDLQPSDQEYQDIKASIEHHGLVDPLIWNSHNGVLIGGHQRLKILIKEFGAKPNTKIPVSVVTIKDKDEEQVLNIELNQKGGAWDWDKLREMTQRHEPGSLWAKLTGFGDEQFKRIREWSSKTSAADVIGTTPRERLAGYEAGLIKQIVLYYSSKDYTAKIAAFEKIMKENKLSADDGNTGVVDFLQEFYEKNRKAKN